MQQYLTHLEKIAIVTSKKSIVMCFYPLKQIRFLYLKM